MRRSATRCLFLLLVVSAVLGATLAMQTFNENFTNGLSAELAHELALNGADYYEIDLDVANEIINSETDMSTRTLMFPGTRWCGPGNIAFNNPNSLGIFSSTDSCCRDHDQCPDYINGFTSKYGLTNTGLIIRLRCDCDLQFFNCLKATNSIISNKIGVIYFNLIGNDCFKEDFPIVSCLQFSSSGNRCLSYQLDTTQAKRYQWFNNPIY